MYRYILAIILLAALCLPLACTDKKSTNPPAAVTTIDTLVVRDIDYAQRVIYDLGRLPLRRAASDTMPEPDKYDFVFRDDSYGIIGDSIVRLIVYVDDLSGDAVERFSRPVGVCYIDPDDTLSDDPTGMFRTVGYFKTIDPVNYYVRRIQFYIEFLVPSIGADDIMAVYMEVLRRRPDSTWVDTIGDISSDTMKLKLIKPSAYQEVNHHVWEYEWRNIYYLGRTNIDLRNLSLDIYHGVPISNQEIDPSDLNYNNDGIEYIRILGLDKGDNNGVGMPDGEVDRYVYTDQVLGLLVFPARHPFNDTISYVNNDYGHPIYLNDSVPEIYIDNDPAHLSAASRYYLGIFYKKP